MKRRRKLKNIACHFVVGTKKVNTLFVCSRHSNSRFDYELKLMELCWRMLEKISKHAIPAISSMRPYSNMVSINGNLQGNRM